jgi:2-polyprenyl-3-methyl-5-hydroxy-6-metoxy-1,4-benzoquinol methylase
MQTQGSWMNAQECDLCSNTDFQQIADYDRDGQPLSTVICSSCGLVRHECVPTEEELRQFYSNDYRQTYNGERTPGLRRIMRAWNNGLRIHKQFANYLPARGSVLEIGAGIGCTVKAFERAGFEARGIDPGGEFLSFSHDKLQADVQVGSLYDLPEDNATDSVLLIHVIEHLRSPMTALRKIGSLLKPGGLLYVECPNLAAPFARRSRLFHTAHIHNFVPATLQMLAEAAGYTLQKRFGDDRDTNLQMLFEFTGHCQLTIDAENVSRTIKQLKRADTLPYLARPQYVFDRTVKLASYAKEHLQAKHFVAQVIEECSTQNPDQQKVATLPDSAAITGSVIAA